MHKLVLVPLAAIALGCWLAGQQTTQVPYTDVGHRVQIIGRFGLPIGTYLELAGTKFADSKGPTKIGGANFRIESVNGKKLTPPVELWIDPLKEMATGKRFKVIGYETGQMIGVPDQVLERTGGPGPQAGWQFVVEFVPIKVE